MGGRQPGSRGSRGRTDFPPLNWPSYGPTKSRAPAQPAVQPPADMIDMWSPWSQEFDLADDNDLTTNAGTGALPIGEKIVVEGGVYDEAGTPVAGALVEVWQANAAGRYVHGRDNHDAPLDPNFTGVGHCITSEDGVFRFLTISPGAYPVPGTGIWRPKHIHFSILGHRWASRVVTQLYFPGDPLQKYDPIFLSIPETARERLVADYEESLTIPDEALGYRFDVILAGGSRLTDA